MAKYPKNQPAELNEKELDETKGGIGLLHDAGIGLLQPTDQTGQKAASHTGGVNVLLADGSVRKA